MYIREAMEEAGKPFGELSSEQIGAALRAYEVARSHRVAHIVGKSGKIGSMFMMMGYLVSARLKPQAACVWESSVQLSSLVLRPCVLTAAKVCDALHPEQASPAWQVPGAYTVVTPTPTPTCRRAQVLICVLKSGGGGGGGPVFQIYSVHAVLS